MRALNAGSRLRIVVLGYIVRGPLGGLAWHHLQYVIGLSRLGHDVFYLEDSDDFPSCYDPGTNEEGIDPTYGLAFASRVFDRVGLAERWAYYDGHRAAWHGPLSSRVREICASADLCLNLSGLNPLRCGVESIPVRALIDTDPVFTQIRHLTEPESADRARSHTAFLTFAENLPTGLSSIPDDGLPWQRTRQPVVLDLWPVTPAPRAARLTSVMLWESYEAREFNGRRYGLKGDSFGPYIDLPSRVGRIFELALGSPTAPGPLLEEYGWSLVDPREPTVDPWTYQQYIRESKAEFGIAKHAYVVARTGWFSERSTGYLASGRPVIVQDTGFTAWLDAGAGVLPFTTPDEAVAAIDDLDARYERHCGAAREIAAAFFDSSAVLADVIEKSAGTRVGQHAGETMLNHG